ncbi:probable receptor-like protein kinase At5g39020 isoform X2 [Vicia villosa]|uniref:probable receptor-like protein kinase At5g39020 isoform X2 n=1 Tax=Vicia villosa TaxID=3911 RepID=UPI00273AA5F6|nr:probable receptor-like protein kinase At5g39020 isoform X2 [Vicia villosa]
MMIMTKYLAKGDLRDFMKRKGALKPSTAVRFALDIARGAGYLHENKPSPIIHRDLEPSDLKVAEFGVSKLLIVKDKPLTCEDTSSKLFGGVMRSLLCTSISTLGCPTLLLQLFFGVFWRRFGFGKDYSRRIGNRLLQIWSCVFSSLVAPTFCRPQCGS